MKLEKSRALFFELVANVPADQWDARLSDLAGDDAELRQRVSILLAAHQEPGSFLESPAAGLAVPLGGGAPGGRSADSADPLLRDGPGAVIGPYKLLEQIGEGGFGVVYMAEQTEPVRRKVALKILKPGMDTKQVVARFEAERQALAIMDHPNIAKVFDGGYTGVRDQGFANLMPDSCLVTPDLGRPYFVMELVRGVPITEFCDHNQLTPRQRLELFITVCQAVQHAHQKGIIHRDLKPANVIVSRHDSTPVVKVIDFGVAKALGQELTDKTLFTGFAQMIGTPLYMSPEQAGMSDLDIDTRSDIYSLGVLLYELLTGTTPFDRERFKKAAHDEIRRIIREEDPPKPSTRLSELGRSGEPAARLSRPSRETRAHSTLASVAAQRHTEPSKLRKLVKGELDWIVMKALEKDRSRRYETANGLVMDVKRYLADEPVQACPPSAGYRLRKFARRHKSGLLAGTCVALGLLLAGVALLWREKVAADRAVAVAQENESAEAAARKKVENSLYFESISRAHLEWWNNDVGRADQILRQSASEYRNWEWHYLKGLCQSALFTFRGHADAVHDVAFSPDGLRLASAGKDATVRIWDLETGRVFLKLQHQESVKSVCFSPDGRRLAAGGGIWGSRRPGELKVWDLATGRAQLDISGQGEMVTGVAFHPEGRILASAGFDGTIKLWNLDTGEEIRTLRGHTGPVRCVSFSLDGSRIASGGNDGMVKIWDAVDRRVLLSLPANASVESLAFGPEGKRLVVGDYSSTANLWWDPNSNRSQFLNGHSGLIYGVDFSPDGQWVATASADGSAKVWDAKNGQENQTIRGHTGAVYSIAFSPGDRCLATAGRDGTVKVFDLSKSQTERTIRLTKQGEIRAGNFTRIAFSPDGSRLAGAARDLAETYNRPSYLQVWDSATSELLLRVKRPAGFRSVTYSPDGKRLAADWGADIKILDAQTGSECTTLTGHSQQVNVVVYHPLDQRLASASDDSTVRVWDLTTGKTLVTLTGHAKPVTGIVFHPKGKLLASTSQDGTWRLWETDNGRPVFRRTGGTEALNWVTFSPNGEHFASAGADGAVRIWETRTGEMVRSLPAHVGPATSVSYSEDGLRIASSGEDSKVRVWDSQTGQEALTLKGNWHEAHSVAFCPKGRYLAAGYMQGMVSIWERTGDLSDRHIHNTLAWRAREAEGAIARRQWTAAFVHLDRLIAEQPENAQWLYHRGEAHQGLGNWSKALTDYWQALSHNPKHENALWALIHVTRSQENRDKTLAFFKSAIATTPDNALAHWYVGNVLWYQGKIHESLGYFKTGSELDPTGLWHHHSLGNNLRDLNRLDEAIVAYAKAIKLDANDAQIHCDLAFTLERMGRIKDAISCWKRTVENDANHVVAHTSLAWKLATSSDPSLLDPQAAIVHARKAIDLQPKEPNYWSNMGVALFRAGNAKLAVKVLEKADQMSPGGDNHRRFFLAMAYWQIGDKDKARQTYAKSVEWMDKHQPNNEELRRFRAEAEAMIGKSAPVIDIPLLNQQLTTLRKDPAKHDPHALS